MTLSLERVIMLDASEPTSGGTTVNDVQSEREAQVAEALNRSMQADPLVPAIVRLEALRRTRDGSVK